MHAVCEELRKKQCGYITVAVEGYAYLKGDKEVSSAVHDRISKHWKRNYAK